MSESPADPKDKGKEPAKPTRRELIAGIAALVAGAAATPAQEAAATSGAAFIVDAINTAEASSMLAALNSSSSPRPAALDVRRVGLGTALHVEAGSNFLSVSTTADFAVSALSNRIAVVGGTGSNRVLLRANLLAAAEREAGIFGFSNSAGAPAVEAIHGPDLSLFNVTHTAAAMHAVTAEEDGSALKIVHLAGGVALDATGDVVVDGNIFATGSGVPAVCRKFTVPANVSTFVFTDPEIQPDSLLFGAFNGQAGRPSAPVWVIHFVPLNGRGRAVFNAPTVRPTPLTILSFRPCPMS